MSDLANVRSIAVVQEFKNALAQFASESKQGLVALSLEIRRAVDWVTVDRAQYWRGEIRRAMDAIARAKDELARSRTFKRMDDYVPSCIEEKKAVEKAQQRLALAEQKVEAIKKWSRAMQHEINEFTGRVAQFSTVLESDVPRAMAALERILTALDRYVSTNAPAPFAESQLVAPLSSPAMTRPLDEMEERSLTLRVESDGNDAGTRGRGDAEMDEDTAAEVPAADATLEAQP